MPKRPFSGITGLLMIGILLGSLVSLCTGPCEAEPAPAHLILGVQCDTLDAKPLLGIALALSDRITTYATTSWNTVEQDHGMRGVYTVHPSKSLTLGVLLGPQITVINSDPQLNETVTYLTTATGFALAYQFSEKYTLFAGFERLMTDSPVPRYKLAVGLTVPIGDL